MTRQEFIDEIYDFYDLKDWCDENDCDACEDIYSQDEFDDYINEGLYDRARCDDWRDVLSWLENVPTGYDFYDTYNWEGVDCNGYEFDECKDKALNWGDDEEIWEEEEIEEECEEEDEEEEEEELEPIQLEILFVDEPFDDIQQAYTPPAPPKPEPTPTEAPATPEFEFKEEPLCPISELYGEITII